MFKQPPPVMHPTGIPQQRLYVVPGLPEKPDDLELLLGYPGVDGIPKKMPRGASFLLQTRVGVVAGA